MESARGLFNSGSEVTLIREQFALDKKLSSESVSYMLLGVGGNPVNYSTYSNSKIYTVPLLTTTGKSMKKTTHMWNPETKLFK